MSQYASICMKGHVYRNARLLIQGRRMLRQRHSDDRRTEDANGDGILLQSPFAYLDHVHASLCERLDALHEESHPLEGSSRMDIHDGALVLNRVMPGVVLVIPRFLRFASTLHSAHGHERYLLRP